MHNTFNIVSEDNMINFNLLPVGTKETVYLALKLAVLDHLFPNDGGIIVLDAPLNDMDNDHVAVLQAYKRMCKSQQVISLTCRDEYSEPSGVTGKEIHI